MSPPSLTQRTSQHSDSPTGGLSESAGPSRAPRRWLVLGAVALAQLMIAVDATVLAIALPDARADLAMTPAQASWAISGYVLTAGALMIVGGRVAQRFGLRLVMTCGLIAFGAFSLLGGAAWSGGVLVLARIGQGVSAAALTPAAMARLSLAFPEEGRQRAYGIFGVVMGSGTAIGVLLGGVLTEVGGWRWCMYVNVAFVLASLLLSSRAGDRHPATRQSVSLGRGVVFALGAGGLVVALTTADSWWALGALGGAVVALALFRGLDRRARDPLLPSGLFAQSDRQVAYAGLFLWGVATIGTFVAVSDLMQHRFGTGPLATGLLFLVYPAAVQISLRASKSLRENVTGSISTGLVLIMVGLATLVVLAETTGPAALLTVPLAFMGLGTAMVMPVANGAATKDAGEHSAVAGGVGTTLQQIGASLGAALPVLTAAVAPWLTDAGTAGVALTQAATGLTLVAVLAGLTALGVARRRRRS